MNFNWPAASSPSSVPMFNQGSMLAPSFNLTPFGTASTIARVPVPGNFADDPAAYFKQIQEQTPNIKQIDFESCKLSSLAGFEHLSAFLPEVAQLNLENNLIVDYRELNHLRNIFSLRHLTLRGTPLFAHPHYRSTVTQLLPQLTTLDGAAIETTTKAAEAEISLISLLDQAVYPDLRIEVLSSVEKELAPKPLLAHRAILATRSPKFADLIAKASEGATQCPVVVKIELEKDMDTNLQLMNLVVRHCYDTSADAFNVSFHNHGQEFLLYLLEIATDFSLPRLIRKVEQDLCLTAALSSTDAMTLLKEADRLGSYVLRKRCLQTLALDTATHSEKARTDSDIDNKLLLDMLLLQVEQRKTK